MACIEEWKNDDAVKVLTGHESANYEAVINDMAKDKATIDASNADLVDHTKELETTKEDTRAMGENTSNKAKTMRRSSFKITSIVDTTGMKKKKMTWKRLQKQLTYL